MMSGAAGTTKPRLAKRPGMVLIAILAAALSMSATGCEMLSGDFVLKETVNSTDDSETPDVDAALASDAARGTGDAAETNPDATSDPASCAPFPDYRCNGSMLQACRLDGSGARTYSDEQDCEQPERCDPTGGTCLTCSPGAYRCEAEQLYQCQGSDWEPVADCAESGERCDADLGACAECLLNDTRCDAEESNILNKCSVGPEGRRWIDNDCGSLPCRTRDNGAAYCQTCEQEGVSRCLENTGGRASTSFLTCTPDLEWDTTGCGQGAVCESIDGNRAQCVLQ